MSKQKESMDIIDEMIDFLRKSPTKYHFVSNALRLFKKNKFQEVEEINHDDLRIPKKGFFIINRVMIIAFELGSTNKSLIFTSSLESDSIKIIDSGNSDENGSIQCEIDNKVNSNIDPELWDTIDYQFAGEILIEKNSASRQYLFESDQPVGIIENNIANLSLPDTSIQSYLEFYHNIVYQKTNLIEQNLYLVPNSLASSDIYVGPSKSLINHANISTLGSSFLALKALLSSTGKGSCNKFVVISSNQDNINLSTISSYINLILTSKKTSINEESLVFNVGGIESLWASHFPYPTNNKYFSKGVVLQNLNQNQAVLDKLAILGIPIQYADDQEIEYSVDSNQLFVVNEKSPIKISLPLFNYKTTNETASVSDIYNFYNSMYEICLI